MKIIILLPFIVLITGYMVAEYDRYIPKADRLLNQRSESFDTTEFDQEKVLAALREEIKGMEDQPSSEVFQNIKMMKQVPAGRLLRIMEMGFTKSLGTDCTHCHNPDNFADEDKRQKEITREMMKMTGTINNELLAKIPNLESDKPTVNCTTCHRGEVKPALNLNREKE